MPHGLAGGHRGVSKPDQCPGSPCSCTPQSAPPVGTRSACRRLAVCSCSQPLRWTCPDPAASPGGPPPTPTPCARPPASPQPELGLAPAASVYRGVPLRRDRLLSGEPAPMPREPPGSSQEVPGFREGPGNPVGKGVRAVRPAERSPWRWFTRSGDLTQQTGSPTGRRPAPGDGDTAQRSGTAASGVSKGCKPSQQQPRRKLC